MKRIILPILLGLGVSASAQHTQKPTDVQKSTPGNFSQGDLIRTENPRPEEFVGGDRGSTFFYENFSNGLDGSTAYGSWEVSDNADGTIWHMANASGPEGPIVGDFIGSLASESAADGWVIFDPDWYIGLNPSWDDADGAYTTGYLTSPEINMSSLNSVLVDFQQYFIYCCYPFSPLTVEVSIDNQNTWFVFPGEGDFFPSANVLSDNPLRTVIDISCVAANQPSVYIRFAYNSAGEPGYNYYIWGIDDVRVYENTVTDDIAVSETMNGDIVNSWEYRVTPFEQRILAADGGVFAGVVFSNKGTNAQTGVTALVEFLDDANNVVYTYESDPIDLASTLTNNDCPAAVNDTLFLNTGFEPAAIGTYTMRITVSGDQTDVNPDDNVLEKTIVFSTDEYGHDDETNLAGYLGSSNASGAYAPAGFGGYYTFPYDGSTAYGVAVRFGTNCANETPFKSALILDDPDLSLTESETIAEKYYFMASNWHNGTYKYFPFDSEVTLDPASVYFACIWKEDESTGQWSVGVEETRDSDLSAGSWEQGGSGDYSWFLFQPYEYSVRLIVSERTSIEENNSVGLQEFSLFPNPANTETRVSFSLLGSRSVAYEVRDLNGKLIDWQNVGDFAPGQNSFTVNVSDIASGNYMLNLVIDGQSLFSRQLNVTH